MTASTEQAALTALHLAKASRLIAKASTLAEREATVKFMDAARDDAWRWDRIGRELGVTSTAARRYYERNRGKLHNGPR